MPDDNMTKFEIACGLLVTFSGGCPGTNYGWEHPKGCHNVCGEYEGCADNPEKCWEIYCTEQAGKEE